MICQKFDLPTVKYCTSVGQKKLTKLFIALGYGVWSGNFICIGILCTAATPCILLWRNLTAF